MMSDTPRTDAHYKQILDDDLGLEYNETELRYWAEKLERELAEVKEQLRLCNIDQFTTAAELAEAVTKERERCAKECIAMADDFEFKVNQRGLVEKMKHCFGVK